MTDPATRPRVLILGGTSEANALARRIAADPRFRLELSLAGRTRAPVREPGIETRIGGFGGADGLARYVEANGVAVLVDATHPFATRISANARMAAAQTGRPLVRLDRPGWQAQQGDTWQEVGTLADAATALGQRSRRVLLAVGRLGLAAFAGHPQHDYIARTIDAPEPGAILPRHLQLIRDRGPFRLEDEAALLAGMRVEIIVTKNSGGAGAYQKLVAARGLKIPVILVARPCIASGAAPNADVAYDQLVRAHGMLPSAQSAACEKRSV